MKKSKYFNILLIIIVFLIIFSTYMLFGALSKKNPTKIEHDDNQAQETSITHSFDNLTLENLHSYDSILNNFDEIIEHGQLINQNQNNAEESITDEQAEGKINQNDHVELQNQCIINGSTNNISSTELQGQIDIEHEGIVEINNDQGIVEKNEIPWNDVEIEDLIIFYK